MSAMQTLSGKIQYLWYKFGVGQMGLYYAVYLPQKTTPTSLNDAVSSVTKPTITKFLFRNVTDSEDLIKSISALS